MAEENKTVLLKIDLDVSGLKKNGKEAEAQLEKLKIQQSLMRSNNQQGTLEYAKINEQIKQYTKQLKDSAAALVINENLTGKSNLTDIEKAQAQKALAVAYNNLTDEQRENTAEGQKIAAQYKSVNDSLIKNGLAVSDGRRNVGRYKEAVIEAYKELGTFKKEATQIGFAIGSTKKDIDETSASLDQMRSEGKAGTQAFVKLENELEGLNEILESQNTILSEVNSEIEKQTEVTKEAEKEARKIGFVYGEQKETVQSLKQELKDLQNTLAANSDNKLSAEYQQAAERAGEVRDRLNEVKETTNSLAGGSSFEKFSNTLGGVGADLANLDFEGVSEKMKQLEEISNGTTFKETIGGLKSMGSAFISLGKVILANPLFLLVAVVAAVAGALVYFSQETETAEEANDKLNETLELQQGILDRQAEKLQRAGQNRLKYLELQGASEKELLGQQKENLLNEELARQDNVENTLKSINEKNKILKRAYDDDDEELYKKIAGEIKGLNTKYKTLKNLDGQYFIDRDLLIKASDIKVEEKRKEDLEKQKEANKKAYDDYKSKKDAELKLAQDIANKIREATLKGRELTAQNERTIIESQAEYLTKIANLTISDAVKLNEELLKIETEKYEKIKSVDQKEKQLSIDRINSAQAEEIKALQGSAEKIAEQKKLIEENSAKEIEAVNLQYSKLAQDREVEALSAQQTILDAKKEANEKSLNDQIIDLEANLQIQKNLGQETAQTQIAIADATNKQIQADQEKTIAEKKKAQADYEATVIAINKESVDKQLEQEKELAEKKKELQDNITSASQELVADLFAFQSQENQKELDEVTQANAKKAESLQQQLDAGIISQADFDAKKKKLDEESKKKESEVKKKAFESDKQGQIINATIATAVAVAKALPNPVLAVLAGVLGAAQIALIASQPTPAFADGGRVLSGQKITGADGISIRRPNGDNLLATVRTNEIITNESQQRIIEGIAGADIWHRAGVKGFADGGYTGNNISNSVNRQMDMGNLILKAVSNLPAPVVAVQDIISGSNQYVDVVDSATI